MRILYISKYTILPEYGAATRQYFLSKGLSDRGNEVMLIGSRSTLGKVPKVNGLFRSSKTSHLQLITLNGPEVTAGFNLRRLKSWYIFEQQILRFRKYIREFKPEVVVVSSLSILTFLSGVFLKRWLKIPLVVEVRDIYPLTLIEVGGYKKSHPAVRFLGWVEKFGYKNADLIMSTLPNAKEHVASVIKKPFKFKWLPMGVDPAYFDQPAGSFPEFRKEGEFWIGYAGTLGVANALDTLFETAVELELSHPQIKFGIIGDGPLKASFQTKYGHLKNLVFFDAIPKVALQDFLTKMHVLVNTWLDKPIYRFGISPNKWIDYMLSGRPILVAFSGFPCIVDEAGCGKFVPAENKSALKQGILDFFAMERSELDEMGEKGRKYLLEQLDYRILSEQLEETLSRLTNKTKTFVNE